MWLVLCTDVFLKYCFSQKPRFKATPFLFLVVPHFPGHVSELEAIPLLRHCISHLLVAMLLSCWGASKKQRSAWGLAAHVLRTNKKCSTAVFLHCKTMFSRFSLCVKACFWRLSLLLTLLHIAITCLTERKHGEIKVALGKTNPTMLLLRNPPIHPYPKAALIIPMDKLR